MARPVQCAKHRGNTPIARLYYRRWNVRLWCQCWPLANRPTRSSANTAPRKTRRARRPRIRRILHTKQYIRCREVASCRLATLNASRVVVTWWTSKLCISLCLCFQVLTQLGGCCTTSSRNKSKESGGRLRRTYLIYSPWRAERIKLQINCGYIVRSLYPKGC